MNYLWDVSVIKSGEKKFLTGYQFYAKDAKGAIEQGEKFGTVVKVVYSEFDED